ncbi:MAG: DMT family transporter [Gammaproteobacteria bacterium]
MKTNLRAFLLLTILGLMWSFSFIIARFVTTHGVSPVGYSFLHTLGAAILMLIALWMFKEKLPCSGKHLSFYFFCGLIGVALPNTNKYFAAQHLPAGLLGVIINSSPLWTYALALSFKSENFSWKRFGGILCGVAGILSLILEKTHIGPYAASELPWILASLLSPCCFALTAIYIAKQAKGMSPLALICGMLIAATLMLTPLTFGTHNFYFPHQLNLVNGAIFLEIILASLGYIILFKLLHLAGPVYFSLVDGIIVITAPLLGALFFSEPLSYWMLASVVLILSAIALVTPWQRSH